MRRRPLTPRQKEILSYIIKNIRTRGFPPTLRDIGRNFGIRSTKGVNDHLDALQKKGAIRRHPDVSRGIEVLALSGGGQEGQAVPVVGSIAAGAPLLATENVEETLVLDKKLAGGEGNFLLRVQGDSMINAHICHGDYILVRPQKTAEPGEIVAALIDDEATVKRFYKDRKRVRLEAENDAMKPILVGPRDASIRILGKVVSVFRVL